eukprot:ANDGO_02206.mRNA.1 hypothetical protein
MSDVDTGDLLQSAVSDASDIEGLSSSDVLARVEAIRECLKSSCSYLFRSGMQTSPSLSSDAESFLLPVAAVVPSSADPGAYSCLEVSADDLTSTVFPFLYRVLHVSLSHITSLKERSHSAGIIGSHGFEGELSPVPFPPKHPKAPSIGGASNELSALHAQSPLPPSLSSPSSSSPSSPAKSTVGVRGSAPGSERHHRNGSGDKSQIGDGSSNNGSNSSGSSGGNSRDENPPVEMEVNSLYAWMYVAGTCLELYITYFPALLSHHENLRVLESARAPSNGGSLNALAYARLSRDAWSELALDALFVIHVSTRDRCGDLTPPGKLVRHACRALMADFRQIPSTMLPGDISNVATDALLNELVARSRTSVHAALENPMTSNRNSVRISRGYESAVVSASDDELARVNYYVNNRGLMEKLLEFANCDVVVASCCAQLILILIRHPAAFTEFMELHGFVKITAAVSTLMDRVDEQRKSNSCVDEDKLASIANRLSVLQFVGERNASVAEYLVHHARFMQSLLTVVSIPDANLDAVFSNTLGMVFNVLTVCVEVSAESVVASMGHHGLVCAYDLLSMVNAGAEEDRMELLYSMIRFLYALAENLDPVQFKAAFVDLRRMDWMKLFTCLLLDLTSPTQVDVQMSALSLLDEYPESSTADVSAYSSNTSRHLLREPSSTFLFPDAHALSMYIDKVPLYVPGTLMSSLSPAMNRSSGNSRHGSHNCGLLPYSQQQHQQQQQQQQPRHHDDVDKDDATSAQSLLHTRCVLGLLYCCTLFLKQDERNRHRAYELGLVRWVTHFLATYLSLPAFLQRQTYIQAIDILAVLHVFLSFGETVDRTVCTLFEPLGMPESHDSGRICSSTFQYCYQLALHVSQDGKDPELERLLISIFANCAGSQIWVTQHSEEVSRLLSLVEPIIGSNTGLASEKLRLLLHLMRDTEVKQSLLRSSSFVHSVISIWSISPPNLSLRRSCANLLDKLVRSDADGCRWLLSPSVPTNSSDTNFLSLLISEIASLLDSSQSMDVIRHWFGLIHSSEDPPISSIANDFKERSIGNLDQILDMIWSNVQVWDSIFCIPGIGLEVLEGGLWESCCVLYAVLDHLVKDYVGGCSPVSLEQVQRYLAIQVHVIGLSTSIISHGIRISDALLIPWFNLLYPMVEQPYVKRSAMLNSGESVGQLQERSFSRAFQSYWNSRLFCVLSNLSYAAKVGSADFSRVIIAEHPDFASRMISTFLYVRSEPWNQNPAPRTDISGTSSPVSEEEPVFRRTCHIRVTYSAVKWLRAVRCLAEFWPSARESLLVSDIPRLITQDIVEKFELFDGHDGAVVDVSRPQHQQSSDDVDSMWVLYYLRIMLFLLCDAHYHFHFDHREKNHPREKGRMRALSSATVSTWHTLVKKIKNVLSLSEKDTSETVLCRAGVARALYLILVRFAAPDAHLQSPRERLSGQTGPDGMVAASSVSSLKRPSLGLISHSPSCTVLFPSLQDINFYMDSATLAACGPTLVGCLDVVESLARSHSSNVIHSLNDLRLVRLVLFVLFKAKEGLFDALVETASQNESRIILADVCASAMHAAATAITSNVVFQVTIKKPEYEAVFSTVLEVLRKSARDCSSKVVPTSSSTSSPSSLQHSAGLRNVLYRLCGGSIRMLHSLLKASGAHHSSSSNLLLHFHPSAHDKKRQDPPRPGDETDVDADADDDPAEQGSLVSSVHSHSRQSAPVFLDDLILSARTLDVICHAVRSICVSPPVPLDKDRAVYQLVVPFLELLESVSHHSNARESMLLAQLDVLIDDVKRAFLEYDIVREHASHIKLPRRE